MSEIRMIVGLGNPGKEYEGTRHNVGFEVVELLAREFGIEIKQKKFGAKFGSGNFRDKKLILLKPWQYMNRSGQAVATAAGFYKLDLSDILIVSDDMALAPGRIRVRSKGSAGGHNGLTDIIEKLGSNEFCRLRVGIGQSRPGGDVDYVLGKFGPERELVKEAVGKAKEAACFWIENEIEKVMNKFNEFKE